MRKSTLIICTVAFLISLSNCTNSTSSQQVTPKNAEPIDSAKVSGEPCDVTIANIHFTKSVNNAASNISVDNHKITFTSGEKTDYFSDPNGKLSNTSAPQKSIIPNHLHLVQRLRRDLQMMFTMREYFTFILTTSFFKNNALNKMNEANIA